MQERTDSQSPERGPISGLIDIHCHVLPGVDDGCRTLEQSIECIRQWMRHGFVGSVCTPHMGAGWYPDNNPERAKGWVESLQREVHARGLDYKLWQGGELRLSDNVIEWMEVNGVPTLGDSNKVLVDWWGVEWPDFCDAAMAWLRERGFQPILAHPERMELGDDVLFSTLESLRAEGIWLQGNLNSLSGGEGPNAKARADRLANDHAYHLLATDSHEPSGLIGRVEGLNHLDHPIRQLLLGERIREFLPPR